MISSTGSSVGLSPAPSTIGSSQALSSNVAPEEVQVITFAIAGYQLAVPMNVVVKVVNCPAAIQNSPNRFDLLHLGQHSITVVNLHHHFAAYQAIGTPQAGAFLVVTQLAQGQFYAIAVDTPPDLMDLPVSTLRKLPDSYRQGHPLSIASYVAVLPLLPQGEETLSLFIMNLEQVIRILGIG
jgi:purine-binding chemotaxis protein CheW